MSMRRSDDPNPVDYTGDPCGACDAGTIWLTPEGDTFYCDSCDWELSYEEFKNADMWVRFATDQYPELSADDWLDIINGTKEDDEPEAS
jgi:hypothetical protein